MSLYESAPGQNLDTAKGTLWGVVNPVSYYVDHVRSVGGGDRLDSAWFGAGGALKDKAWAAACDLLNQIAGYPLASPGVTGGGCRKRQRFANRLNGSFATRSLNERKSGASDELPQRSQAAPSLLGLDPQRA